MGSRHSGSNFKGNCDIWNCGYSRAAKFLEHDMKVVECVLSRGFV